MHSQVACVRLLRCSLLWINLATQHKISYFSNIIWWFLFSHFLYLFDYFSWLADLGIFLVGRYIQTRILLWWRIANAPIQRLNHQKLDAVYHWTYFTHRFGEYEKRVLFYWSGSLDSWQCRKFDSFDSLSITLAAFQFKTTALQPIFLGKRMKWAINNRNNWLWVRVSHLLFIVILLASRLPHGPCADQINYNYNSLIN